MALSICMGVLIVLITKDLKRIIRVKKIFDFSMSVYVGLWMLWNDLAYSPDDAYERKVLMIDRLNVRQSGGAR